MKNIKIALLGLSLVFAVAFFNACQKEPLQNEQKNSDLKGLEINLDEFTRTIESGEKLTFHLKNNESGVEATLVRNGNQIVQRSRQYFASGSNVRFDYTSSYIGSKKRSEENGKICLIKS